MSAGPATGSGTPVVVEKGVVAAAVKKQEGLSIPSSAFTASSR